MINGTMNVKDEIKRVIELEKNTLEDLLQAVDDSVVKAVELILAGSGKLIVSGMGKSGHIASKIASTFTSTGTLAVFMHPAEGMHGDLGVVSNDDVVLLLSHSGESDEMIGLLPCLKQLQCKTIAITSNLTSTLAKHCDLVIHSPVKQEACSLNLAPTCSTTAALVLGDAIAITLMKIKKFSRQDFALFHPAGRIGKRLLYKVDEFMRSGNQNPVVPMDAGFDVIVSEITRGQVNAVSVVDDNGRIKGLITGYDIRQAFQDSSNIKELTAKEIMFSEPTTISKGTFAVKAYELMKNNPKPLPVLPVLENEEVVGIITIQDMVRAGL